MLDPQKKIIYTTLQNPGQPPESRLVTTEELELLRNNRADIKDVQTIKEIGEPGRFSGTQARDLDFLVSHLAKSKGDLADFYGLDPDQLREKVAVAADVKVRLIRVTEVVDPILESFLIRQTERSIDEGANLIIFEIESPGGLLQSAESLARYIADLEQRKIRTIAYIPDYAYSGAALVSLGCDEIYLRENARIGDAGAIAELGKEGKFEHVPEKILGPYKEILRNLAKLKNRPPAIAEAMAFKDLVVYQVTHRDNGRTWFMSEQEIHDSNGEWIKGPAVPESGNSQLLTVSGERAVELKIAKAVVKDLDDLKGWLSIPLEVKLNPVGRTWIDTLIFVLASPVVSGFLLFLGILCLYIELHSFTGFFAIISIICFAIYFWSKFLGGTAGWLEVILFSLGLLFLGIEMFVIPGFGIFGLSGLLLIVGSLIMASQTLSGLDAEFDIKQMAKGLKEIFAALISVIIVASIINRYLPRIPVINSAMLLPPGGIPHDDEAPRLRPDLVLQNELQKDNDFMRFMGMRGVALTLLRPSGKAKILDKTIDVVSEGNFIKEGSAIEVIKIAGNIITVRQV
jgi:membrane-bound serine protease (ClpP class)